MKCLSFDWTLPPGSHLNKKLDQKQTTVRSSCPLLVSASADLRGHPSEVTDSRDVGRQMVGLRSVGVPVRNQCPDSPDQSQVSPSSVCLCSFTVGLDISHSTS